VSESLTISLPESIPPLCVGTKEAARLIGLSERKVSDLVHAGKLPYVQPGGPGGKILFRVEALRNWLTANETTVPPKKSEARRSTNHASEE
jgi:excisionase family DNA binding protein